MPVVHEYCYPFKGYRIQPTSNPSIYLLETESDDGRADSLWLVQPPPVPPRLQSSPADGHSEAVPQQQSASCSDSTSEDFLETATEVRNNLQQSKGAMNYLPTGRNIPPGVNIVRAGNYINYYDMYGRMIGQQCLNPTVNQSSGSNHPQGGMFPSYQDFSVPPPTFLFVNQYNPMPQQWQMFGGAENAPREMQQRHEELNNTQPNYYHANMGGAGANLCEMLYKERCDELRYETSDEGNQPSSTSSSEEAPKEFIQPQDGTSNLQNPQQLELPEELMRPGTRNLRKSPQLELLDLADIVEEEQLRIRDILFGEAKFSNEGEPHRVISNEGSETVEVQVEPVTSESKEQAEIKAPGGADECSGLGDAVDQLDLLISSVSLQEMQPGTIAESSQASAVKHSVPPLPGNPALSSMKQINPSKPLKDVNVQDHREMELSPSSSSDIANKCLKLIDDMFADIVY